MMHRYHLPGEGAPAPIVGYKSSGFYVTSPDSAKSNLPREFRHSSDRVLLCRLKS